jgi:hypothetical protein
MTTKEIRLLVAKSSNSDFLNKVEETFDFSYINFKNTYTGVSTIYEFVSQQCVGWEGLGDSIPEELKLSKSYFIDLKNVIEVFINNHVNDSYNNNYWINQVRPAKDRFYQLNPFVYNCPETDFLIKVKKENPPYSLGAYQFIIKASNFNTNNRDHLIGYLLAYEFLFKDKSDIVGRLNSEKKSLSTLRNEFQKYLSESENQLVNHLKGANDNYTEYVRKIDLLKDEKNTLFEDWYKSTQDSFSQFDQKSTKRIEELEKTYEEKLRLSEPANYWSNRAEKLSKQGWKAFCGIIIFTIFIGIILFGILSFVPEYLVSDWEKGNKIPVIKWGLGLILFLSFSAYCMRAITKVMFSSFHLARDSEERNTLTYFYLSLVNDSKIDEKDRHLVVQSLFSRADTGLLKEDSSPTMPNDFVGKIFGKD